MDLIKLSIKRPSVLIVMLSLLLIGGFYSYKLLNYELIPKFEVNVVTISTVYAGASPSEIESTITKRIEDAVSALENIKKIHLMRHKEKLMLFVLTYLLMLKNLHLVNFLFRIYQSFL